MFITSESERDINVWTGHSQHGDSQRGFFTKVKSKHLYFKNAYKDTISQTKFQRKTIYI